MYFKVMFLNVKRVREVSRHASALRRFCQFFDLTPDVMLEYPDSYYIRLPDDQKLTCELINALDAYCFFHKIAGRVCSTYSFDEYIKLLNEKLLDRN